MLDESWQLVEVVIIPSTYNQHPSPAAGATSDDFLWRKIQGEGDVETGMVTPKKQPAVPHTEFSRQQGDPHLAFLQSSAGMMAGGVGPAYPVTPGGPETPGNPNAMGQCPVCDKYFPSKSLEKHVIRCLESNCADEQGLSDGQFGDIPAWIEATTTGLDEALANPSAVSSEDLSYIERVFTQRLSEVRSLKLLLQESGLPAHVTNSPMLLGMSPTSMMAADEALARKCMEDMELEEKRRTEAKANEEDEALAALRLAESTCMQCHETVDNMIQLNCDHRTCNNCLSIHVQTCIESEDYDCHIVCPAARCGVNLEQWQIKRVLSKEDFDRYLHRTFMSTVEAEDSLIICPNKECGNIVEKMEASASLAMNEAEQVGMTGQPLQGAALAHCRVCRFRCRQCDTVFCSSCSHAPYHIGFTCEEFEKYKRAAKCRYCDDVVERPVPFNTQELMSESAQQIIATMKSRKVQVSSGHPAYASPTTLVRHLITIEENVCMNDECRANTETGCLKSLPCGHPCFGLISDNEHGCMPCLHPDCVRDRNGQGQEDFCNICWTEALRKEPCLRLACGHIFHAECVKNKIKAGQNSTRIVFSYLECPLCKKHMSHPSLQQELRPHVQLYEKVKAKALQRLEFENLKNDGMIKPGGKFAGDPLGFAMKKFAYYPCFKCKEPYFGGHRACEALAEEGFNAENKPEDLVCPPCTAGPGVSECKKHGKDFLEYKCKFCCSVANWYCWGSTHFCDSCHKKQGTPEAMTRKKKSDYDKCKGGPTCPLKIAHHPPAGEEFVLGCAVCRHSSPGF